MKLNGMSKIDNGGGDYLVLTDYGKEGIVVSNQCNTVEEAVNYVMYNRCSSPHAVVKLIDVSISLEVAPVTTR